MHLFWFILCGRKIEGRLFSDMLETNGQTVVKKSARFKTDNDYKNEEKLILFNATNVLNQDLVLFYKFLFATMEIILTICIH